MSTHVHNGAPKKKKLILVFGSLSENIRCLHVPTFHPSPGLGISQFAVERVLVTLGLTEFKKNNDFFCIRGKSL